MTKQKNKKRLVRSRMQATGESYQTALRSVEGEAGPPPPPPPSHFQLRYLSHSLELGPKGITVGRFAACDLKLDDDPLVSRKHATFRLLDGQVFVEDHGSRNGVLVGGKRISGRAALAHGDVIAIGNTALTLVDANVSGEVVVAKAPPPAIPVVVGVGATLASRYLLTRLVSSADDASPFDVYEARHVLLGGEVAIKLLPAARGRKQPALRAWLLREGRALQRASHPKIPRVHDISESDAGDVYLVLDRTRGESLAMRLGLGRAPISEPMALSITRQVAEMLAHLHERGIVRRAFRSDVLRIEEAGDDVVVRMESLDWALLDGDPSLVLPDAGVLPIEWLAPEQRRGEDGDARSDLFALGLLVKRLLASQPAARPSGNPPLDAICESLLARDHETRYASAKALLRALG